MKENEGEKEREEKTNPFLIVLIDRKCLFSSLVRAEGKMNRERKCALCKINLLLFYEEKQFSNNLTNLLCLLSLHTICLRWI